MRKQTVTVLPGEGIGPEVMRATLRVLEAMGVPLEWDIIQPLGKDGVLNPAVIESLERNLIGLKSATESEGHRSFNVALRERFDLYANDRPVCTVSGVKTRFSDCHIDLLIVRQGTEDIYIGEEREIEGGAEAVARFTRMECHRIAVHAFEVARKRALGRGKVTVIHKANILPKTHGLFLSAAREVAQRYPDVECEDLIADAFMMKLVQDPERFDVILTTNFLGDLISDLAAGLVGGLGVVPGINIGPRVVVAETVHGTGKRDIAGQGIANPTAMMLTAAMLLSQLGLSNLVLELRSAVYGVIEGGVLVTKDLNPIHYVSTEAFTDAVIAAL